MNSLASATTATDASAEEAAGSQLGPQDPAGAELSAQDRRQLDALRKAGDIGAEVQNPTQAQNAKKILHDVGDPDGMATDNDIATNAT